MGIAEEAADAGLGNESGEPVQVLEELESCHRQSMTRIHHEGKSSFLRKSSRFCGFDAKNYPLESPKSLIILALIADLAVEEKRALRTVVDELIALEQAADPPAAE